MSKDLLAAHVKIDYAETCVGIYRKQDAQYSSIEMSGRILTWIELNKKTKFKDSAIFLNIDFGRFEWQKDEYGEKKDSVIGHAFVKHTDEELVVRSHILLPHNIFDTLLCMPNEIMKFEPIFYRENEEVVVERGAIEGDKYFIERAYFIPVIIEE